jgi:hypothetical protein
MFKKIIQVNESILIPTERENEPLRGLLEKILLEQRSLLRKETFTKLLNDIRHLDTWCELFEYIAKNLPYKKVIAYYDIFFKDYTKYHQPFPPHITYAGSEFFSEEYDEFRYNNQDKFNKLKVAYSILEYLPRRYVVPFLKKLLEEYGLYDELKKIEGRGPEQYKTPFHIPYPEHMRQLASVVVSRLSVRELSALLKSFPPEKKHIRYVLMHLLYCSNPTIQLKLWLSGRSLIGRIRNLF